jgi:hypothetical protein
MRSEQEVKGGSQVRASIQGGVLKEDEMKKIIINSWKK